MVRSIKLGYSMSRALTLIIVIVLAESATNISPLTKCIIKLEIRSAFCGTWYILVKNLTPPSCSSTPIFYKMRKFQQFGH